MTLKVFNIEKGLHHFLETVKCFNFEKWLHHILMSLKVFQDSYSVECWWTSASEGCLSYHTCVLVDRNFDFLGGYCLLPSGYYWLLVVTWWLLLVTGGYCSLLVVTARYRSLLLVATFPTILILHCCRLICEMKCNHSLASWNFNLHWNSPPYNSSLRWSFLQKLVIFAKGFISDVWLATSCSFAAWARIVSL